MFISPAYAQDAAAAGGAAGIVMQLAPLMLIFVVFYFLLIRPQQKRAKEHRAMLTQLKRNDRIITAGGIIGTVTKVKEGSEEVEIEIAPNVRINVVRNTISTLIKPVAANDAKPA
ncbi:preprotein translocase subunit YajC [Pseudoroseomonas rhizosphaerae]|uniref:Sec translocon accessory complex subunit YajC n=1 Tax=Teichococcus rhizosphaerae TaxID=1335062 RepID=A0A2C7AGE0_9PROT|nr:preprotein translocase subunit YajC [Pseudoroseomonas rhizosphaerae]PHK96753.1 preprotein translocase subunit YajC [Pseudoroseomonas rhizosphaerae]